jgi:hypothetical protein
MKVSGSLAEGALRPIPEVVVEERLGEGSSGLVRGATGSRRSGVRRSGGAVAGLAALNMSEEAAIGTFFCMGGIAAFFQVWIKMEGTPIRERTDFGACGQQCQRLKDSYHRLRRFQPPHIHLHDLHRDLRGAWLMGWGAALLAARLRAWA